MTLLAEAPFPIEKSLLRKDAWQRVKFGDMAECITDRVDNPAEAGVDRYVGLDHLDPDTLSIRRWGLPTEVESTKLRFQPGDIIFGKRRAYQRKLAVADFEGICSAHAMVLRAREETVIKDFLPVFMQSNVFFERALAISVGSLSPTINWKTLAVQEFDLPPLHEQRRIAEVLWAVEEVGERYDDALVTVRSLLNAVQSRSFDAPTDQFERLKDVGTWLSGGTPPKMNDSHWRGELPWISPKDMKRDILSAAEDNISEDAGLRHSKVVSEGAILIVTRGMILAHTVPICMAGRRLSFNQDIKALVVSDDFNPWFIFYFLKHSHRRLLSVVEDSSHGTKRIASDQLFQLRVPKPSRERQDSLVAEMKNCDEAITANEKQRVRLKSLKKTVIARLLSSGNNNV